MHFYDTLIDIVVGFNALKLGYQVIKMITFLYDEKSGHKINLNSF